MPLACRCWTLSVPLLAVSVLVGCGGGEYRTRVEASATRLKQEADQQKQAAEFAKKFYGLAKIGNSPFQIQVPTQFPAGADLATATLPGANLPGLALAYSAGVADASGGGQYPYYVIVGAVDTTQAGSSKLLSEGGSVKQLEGSGEMVKMIRAALPGGTVGTPESVTITAFGGQQASWSKLRATGEMEFTIGSNRVKLPGIFELYVRVEGGWVGWFAWRVPTSIEPHSKMAELAPQMAGTARFQ